MKSKGRWNREVRGFVRNANGSESPPQANGRQPVDAEAGCRGNTWAEGGELYESQSESFKAYVVEINARFAALYAILLEKEVFTKEEFDRMAAAAVAAADQQAASARDSQ